MKRCSKCGEIKDLSQFYRNRDSKDGYRSDCKGCLKVNVLDLRMAKQADRQAYMKAWGIENADRLRDARLRKEYNISLEQYVAMFEEQGGVCSICLKPQTRALAVDHDHACCPQKGKSCGKCVRGLLCSGCNKALGNFGDSPEILRRAIEYVTAARPR